MKRVIPVVFALFSVIIVAVATAGDAPTPLPTRTPAPAPTPAPGKLIVHEWGTFTGFAGSDGTHLPFTSDVGANLPGFVVTRSEQQQRLDPGNAGLYLDFSKGGLIALQRMETP